MEFLNPDSLIEKTIKVEPHCKSLGAGEHLQLERVGYFFTDPSDHSAGSLTLNKTVGLRDSWAKQSTKQVETKAANPQASKKAKKGGAAPDQDKRALERVRDGDLQSSFERSCCRRCKAGSRGYLGRCAGTLSSMSRAKAVDLTPVLWVPSWSMTC